MALAWFCPRHDRGASSTDSGDGGQQQHALPGAGPWCLRRHTLPTHLLQRLHELLHGDGAAQQRLQNLAVWNVVAGPLSLLATCGLGRPGRGLGGRKTGISSRSHPGARVKLPGPRDPLPGRALGLRSGSPSAGAPAGFPHNAHELKPTIHIELTPYSAKVSSFYQNLFLIFS